MAADDQFDSHLTPEGLVQAAAMHEKYHSVFFDCVVSSPLSRAINTADIVFPGSATSQPPRVLSGIFLNSGSSVEYFLWGRCCPPFARASEFFREINGMLQNGRRLKTSELCVKFPNWDTSRMETEDDVTWTIDALEPQLLSAERGYKGLNYIWDLNATNVVVSAHGGIFSSMFNQHPLILADECMKSRFVNCEGKSVMFYIFL